MTLVLASLRRGTRRQIFVQVSSEQLIQVQARIRSFADGVRPVGIRHHRERLVQLNQLIDKSFRVLVVDIVVSSAMHDQQLSSQVFRKCDG